MPLNHLKNALVDTNFIYCEKKINYLVYMDDPKLFAKTEKGLETLIQTVRIFSEDIEMEFAAEKCAMLIRKSSKPHRTEGIEQPNVEDLKTI